MGLKRGLKVPDSKLRWAADGFRWFHENNATLCLNLVSSEYQDGALCGNNHIYRLILPLFKRHGIHRM